MSFSTIDKGEKVSMDEQEENARLGFIDVNILSDSSIRGALLVTDLETKPYEFRITSPIKPSQIQQILYGRTLSEFILAELICVPLLKACRENINLIIVKQIQLLNMRPHISIPVICIFKKDNNNGQEIIETITHKNYFTEKDGAKIYIDALSVNFDIFEPFERIKLAISEVHKQKLDEKK